MTVNSDKPDFDSPDILARLKLGDAVLFTRLVRQHHRTLVTVARGIIGESLAEEVVQESWLSAYKALPRFEGRSAVKTWLFTIVSNHAKTRLRQELRTVSLDELEESGAPYGQFRDDGHWLSPPLQWHIDSPDKLLEEAQLRKCVDSTLGKLPAAQRAVFTLRDMEQLSLQEICNILSISDSNVRVLLHRARLKLMQVIEHYQETGTC
jgi:RNA polymerase sigma-70 factor, ECF subfamily